MRRDEVIKRLRELREMKARRDALEEIIERTEAALEVLTEDEREIIDKMYVNPVKHGNDKLCEMFSFEVPTIYRRRNKAVEKLEKLM